MKLKNRMKTSIISNNLTINMIKNQDSITYLLKHILIKRSFIFVVHQNLKKTRIDHRLVTNMRNNNNCIILSKQSNIRFYSFKPIRRDN